MPSTYQSSVALGRLAVAGLISILHVFLDGEQMESFGWRIVFAAGGFIALGGLRLRRTLPDTDLAGEAERRRRQPFLGVLLMCTWAASAFAAFPEMLHGREASRLLTGSPPRLSAALRWRLSPPER